MGASTSSGMFNPSAGAGMPGFQEGFQDGGQDQFTTQSDMFTQSMQQPLPGYQLNTNTVFPGNQQQPMTQGNGQLPPGFGALSPIDRSQINPSASIGMTGGGFGGGKSAPQPNNGPTFDSWFQQQLGGNDYNTWKAQNPGKDVFSANKEWRAQFPGASILPPWATVRGGPGGGPALPFNGDLNTIQQNANQLIRSAPGQNPSVSIGMPVQQPNPRMVNPAPAPLPGNRFIPPNAPGATARRPQPGIPFPGQTGLTRPRVAPQPMPINRFTRGRFR